ncbi:MAG: FHA domain-containing protein, partial [Gammaproteobacteria bacterium]
EVAANSKRESKNTSLDISASKVMELEDALQNKDKNEPASRIVESIKYLEDEILNATNFEAVSKENFDASNDIAPKHVPILNQELKSKQASKKEERSIELPEINFPANGNAYDKDKSMSIELFINGKKHTVALDKTSCVVGRDPSCDIVIQNKFVSRAHATILLKDGKFIVEDNSFNGTYIKFNNGQKIHVSKNEQTLVSNGVMSMGKPIDDKSKSVIEFKISQ